jgi:hypothetical protein
LHQCAFCLQLDDPPEQVGPFLYYTRSSPHGQDTILRRCTASGGQQVVLSAGIMQQDAAQASHLLGVEVLGGWAGGQAALALRASRGFGCVQHSTPVTPMGAIDSMSLC